MMTKQRGRCFKSRIKAEVVPDEKAMNKAAAGKDLTEDPAAPLSVGLWTDRQEYRRGEKVHIFIRGNRPFYARILYRDAEGRTLQLLPNPYRTDNYFRGGVTYEIPEGDRDRFSLEISPPFGRRNLFSTPLLLRSAISIWRPQAVFTRLKHVPGTLV